MDGRIHQCKALIDSALVVCVPAKKQSEAHTTVLTFTVEINHVMSNLHVDMCKAAVALLVNFTSGCRRNVDTCMRIIKGVSPCVAQRASS